MSDTAVMGSAVKKEPSNFLRWTALVLISLAMFGNYYIYDSISPLADLLKEQLKFSDSGIGLLNAIYSIPNILMVLIGGIIIDRIGTRKSVFIFTIIIMIGALVTALQGNLFLMATGRLIFGLGAESMIVAITTIIARWFRGKELSFAFGLNLTVARLGSFLALNSPTWGKSLYSNWQTPLWITVGAGVFAVVCISFYYFVDVYATKKYNMPKDGEQDKVVIKELFKFGKSFWFITALCVTFYSAMFPFQTFAIKFFQEAHGTTREVGGNLSSILTLAAMVFTPLFGLLADKIGKRSLLMMVGALAIIPVYLIMAYKVDLAAMIGLHGGFNIALPAFGIEEAVIPYSLIFPMAMMGFAFSMIPAVMWPSVALVVREEKLGTAYGLMTMIQNIGLAGFNILIGWANDFSGASASNPDGYRLGMWIFSILGFLGLFFAFMLRRQEMGPNAHGLELRAAEKKAKAELNAKA
ncbi:MAG: MFS transporter [Ignavibacteriae bacterium]|nr:MFS transporter [Ignavibacteriota bacterium]